MELEKLLSAPKLGILIMPRQNVQPQEPPQQRNTSVIDAICDTWPRGHEQRWRKYTVDGTPNFLTNDWTELPD